MTTKFTVFDKESARKIKKMLKQNKANFLMKKKDDDAPLKSDPVDIPPVNKKTRKPRKKMTKEEKEARRKNRSPEEQNKIDERMDKLRLLRKKRENN